MKQLLFFIIATAVIFNSYSKDENDGLARVHEINGTEAYFMSEPFGDHEVVFDVGARFINSTIEPVINKFVDKTVNHGRRKGKHAKKGRKGKQARRLRSQTRRIRKDAGRIGNQIRRIRKRGQAKRVFRTVKVYKKQNNSIISQVK